MNKQLPLAISLTASMAALVCAEEPRQDLFMYPIDTSAGNMEVSTSMHDFGAAPATYTLGQGKKSSYSEASASSSAASTSTASSGSKDAKVVIPDPVPEPSPFTFAVEAGYQSDYVYRGLAQITNAVFPFDPDEEYDMWYVGVTMQWEGLSAGIKYIRSFDSDMNPRYHPTLTKESAYSEIVFDINYTLGLIAGPQGEGNWLDVTAGYEMLYFEEDTFWNTDMQHTFYGELKMNRYKWVRPSVSYYYIDQNDALDSFSDTAAPGITILEGEQIVLQIDGGDQIYDNGNIQVGLGYYAQVGFDQDYNVFTDGDFEDDWYQFGLSLPVSYENVTVTPSVHYTDRTPSGSNDPEFWWGVNAKYTF